MQNKTIESGPRRGEKGDFNNLLDFHHHTPHPKKKRKAEKQAKEGMNGEKGKSKRKMEKVERFAPGINGKSHFFSACDFCSVVMTNLV